MTNWSIYVIMGSIRDNETKGNKMAYVAYEIKRSKETRRGMIYLVKCNRLGKYAITTWVGSTGSAMGSVECQGNYDYVLKQWNQNFGKERFYPLIG